ncbi:hypothetical protein EQ845_04905 [Pseudomonas putida]|uniref:VPA1269 family protein n=1 Tax=Pseudomonas putida TaxID=303 RepID=UPI00117A8DA8|nr:VPA1269 family protein [Pseudomonas putida]TRO37831.1 hypothetical protein EQ845_04905 [Pseudomonas putida]
MTSRYYETLKEASVAAQKLGFKSRSEYSKRYTEDPRLPSRPWYRYTEVFESDAFFDIAPYQTLEEMSEVVQKLGIKNKRDYSSRRSEDPRLPPQPWITYCDVFESCAFFGRRGNPYRTFVEASEAVQKLGIKSQKEYMKRYKEDCRLPSEPWRRYQDCYEVHAFFGIGVANYRTFEEASKAAQKLGILTRGAYLKRYKEDPRLPSKPWLFYRDVFNYNAFFGIEVARYQTFEQASDAARLLGIKSSEEYRKRYHEDPKLPQAPHFLFSKQWHGYHQFLGCDYNIRRYETLKEAATAVQHLNIKTAPEYRKRYNEDPRLPASPHHYYRGEWLGYPIFLRGTIEKYPTLSDARVAVEKLGLCTSAQYQELHHLDPRLPAKPEIFYRGEWQSYSHFLESKVRNVYYEQLDQASAAALQLGITSKSSYSELRLQDPGLPAAPELHYQPHWIDWHHFLTDPIHLEARPIADIAPLVNSSSRGSINDSSPREENSFHSSRQSRQARECYSTLSEFRDALKRLGITTSTEFRERYVEDEQLPSCPHTTYLDWTSWAAAFDQEGIYTTIDDASEACMRLGFKTAKEYRLGYKADVRLPYKPMNAYKGDWDQWGWKRYLGRPHSCDVKYSTYAEAAAAAQCLRIVDGEDYKKRYVHDPRLHSNPNVFYKDDWQGMLLFLLPVKCKSLADVKQYVRVLNLRSSIIYREECKKYPALPAHPESVFVDEWVDWYDLCGIPRPYSYEELTHLVQSEGVKGSSDYKRFRVQNGDLRIPSEPNVVYQGEWINWARFLGKVEPYAIKNIRAPYLEWANAINSFCETVRGGTPKAVVMCKFVRHHIQALGLGERPELFFSNDQLNRVEFVKLMEGQGAREGQKSFLRAVTEFAEYIINERLTSVDPETGEIVVVLGVINPFLAFAPTIDYGSNVYGETVKPALTYSYVQGLREWILPGTANSFSDLVHLHVFESDWFEIDQEMIDQEDPDCVYRIENGLAKIWTPMSWLHTYALASVPARGRQLGYNDSGEADEEIPRYIEGKVVWVKNTSKLAGMLQCQGFVKRYKDENFGMHFTSNKSSIAHSGYDVAWMPLELARWMIKLREWQSRYNPIARPTRWSECRRTNLNKKQLAAKGANCFIFRDFRDVEVAEYSSKLKPRIACALYHSQPKGMDLASLGGNPYALTLYTSEYTPHTMRVSLITAFIVEFGLPIDIVMKLAGHTNVVVSIYYVKINSGNLRKRFDEAEKIALLDVAKAEMYMIEQKRLDKIRHRLIANLEDGPAIYQGQCASGSVLVRDQGFCPMAGARCSDGGLPIGKTGVRAAVVSGYMGAQNCIRCRHFVTGPAFMGGLLSTANEISLATNFQYEHYAQLEDKVAQLRLEVDNLDEEAYLAERSGEAYDASGLSRLHVTLEKTKSESERVAMKLAELLTDMQYVTRLIKQCHVILQDEAASGYGSEEISDMQIILQQGHEVQLVLTETSRFHLLNEVCESAEIYESASAVFALPSRSQFLDRMMGFNKIWPVMSRLTSAQQLSVGNQLAKFLYLRLKSHERVDLLMDGTLKLQDLAPDEQITRMDLEQFFKPLGLRLEGETQIHNAESKHALVPVIQIGEDYS